LRLAALCLTLPETALILRDKLRLSNEELKRLLKAAALFIGFYGKLKPLDEQSLKVLLFRHGRQAALDALSLAQADAPKGHEALWEDAKKFLSDTPEPKLPFSGKDILAQGIADGPAVGQALRALSERWIKAGFPQDLESLRDLLANLELSDRAVKG
jgi:poly(A) polymerase